MNDEICECGHSINKHYLDNPSEGEPSGYCTHYYEEKHVFCNCRKSPGEIAAALRAETNHRFVVCTYCGWRLDYESEKREAARESANAHALECEKDPRNIENAALRARVGELEQELDELRNIVAAQIVEWKYRVENQPMPTDRLIGIDMCADELSAALAKGAK